MSASVLSRPAMMSPSAATPGRFGPYGGRYVPETLMAALLELDAAYAEAQADEAFQAELAMLLHDYCGRPTPLFFARRMTEVLGGAKVYLKREDLLHTGAHKNNNSLGQALLARRMGQPKVVEAWEQPARPARANALPVGSRVFHQKFGYGKVLAVDDDRLDVLFEKAGQKRLLDRFVEKA